MLGGYSTVLLGTLSAVLTLPDAALVPARASSALALDGKTLRGTIPLGPTQGVQLVAAYLPEHGVPLVQLQVTATANEITVAPTVRGHLALVGVVVTGAAMYTQRPVRVQVVDAGGDYLWLVTDHHPELQQDIEQVCVPDPNELGTMTLPTDFATARTIKQGPGRIEERRRTPRSMLQDSSTWPYLAQVFKLESTLTTAIGTHPTVRYGGTSIPWSVADAGRLLALVRRHGGIENGVH